MELQQSDGHHAEIRHKIVFFQKGSQRAQQFSRVRVPAADSLVKGVLGLVAPVPCVVKCLDLCLGSLARRASEEDVIVLSAVEGRRVTQLVSAARGPKLLHVLLFASDRDRDKAGLAVELVLV